MREIYEYPFSVLDPVEAEHVDPPAVAVFESPLSRGAGGAPRAALASAWDTSPDGLAWRLRLRPDLRFHSGDPCDAGAVVAALERCRWGAGWTRQLWYWDPVDEVRAVGDATVEITLKHPCSRLPVLLWGTHTAIVNPARRWRDGTPYQPGLADGTGPYRVVRADEAMVVAERVRRDAHDPRIEWLAVPDRADRRAALRRVDVDVIRDVSPTWFEDPELAADWRCVEHVENSQYYLALNFDDPRGFGDRSLRQAIEAYVDRDRLVAEAFEGRGDARRSPVPLADDLADTYDAGAHRAMTIDEAQLVFARLGWTRNERGLLRRDDQTMVLDCVAQDTGQGRRVANALATQLRAAGIELQMRYVDVFEPFYRACATRPAAFLSKWLWPDAIEAVLGFSRSDCAADSGGNWQHARVPELDAAYDAFRAARDLATVRVRAGLVQQVFMAQLPYLPLCSPTYAVAVRHGVQGYDTGSHTLYPPYGQISTHGAVRR